MTLFFESDTTIHPRAQAQTIKLTLQASLFLLPIHFHLIYPQLPLCLKQPIILDPSYCVSIFIAFILSKMKVTQSCPTLHSPWISPGQNTGVGSHFLLQGIFPTQGSNPGLPHSRRILYHLSHQRSPRVLEWVAYPFSRGSSRPRNWTGVSCIAGGFFTSWAIRDGVWGNDIEWDVTELLFLGEKTLNNSS